MLSVLIPKGLDKQGNNIYQVVAMDMQGFQKFLYSQGYSLHDIQKYSDVAFREYYSKPKQLNGLSKTQQQVKTQQQINEGPKIKTQQQVKTQQQINEGPKIKTQQQVKTQQQINEGPKIKTQQQNKTQQQINEVHKRKMRSPNEVRNKPKIKPKEKREEEKKETIIPKVNFIIEEKINRNNISSLKPTTIIDVQPLDITSRLQEKQNIIERGIRARWQDRRH